MGLIGSVIWHAVNTVAPDHWYRWAGKTFAQNGEDVLARNHFRNRPPGIYVDVGAHHPHRFSNTFLLYQAGWHGVNIDALPGFASAFERARPRDTNVEVGIGREPGSMEYWMFADPAWNTFDAELGAQRVEEGVELVRRVTVPIRPLAAVLDEVLDDGTEVGLLTVDVEGLDLEVLRSNDWERWRPEMVLVERLFVDPARSADDPIFGFLTERDYALASWVHNTAVFLDRTRG